MSPQFKLYLKSFLFFGIFYPLGFFIFDWYLGEEQDIIGYIIQGLFFASFMTIAFIPIHIEAIRGLGITEITDDILKPHQQKILESRLSIEEIEDHIQNKWKAKKSNLNISDHSILFDIPFSFSSFGEKIEINLLSQHGSTYQYEIKSKPKFLWQLTDFGRNLTNVFNLEKMIG